MVPPYRPYPEIIDLSNDTPVCKKTTTTVAASINTSTTSVTASTTRTRTQEASSRLNEGYAVLSDDFGAIDDYCEERHPKRMKVDSHDTAKNRVKVSTWRSDDIRDLSDAKGSRTDELDQAEQPKKDAQASKKSVPTLSQRTSALLAEIRANRAFEKKRSFERGTSRRGVDSKRTDTSKRKKENKTLLEEESVEENEFPEKPTRGRRVKTSKFTETEKLERVESKKAQREQEKRGRLEEKAAEKERKERLKEEKAREKKIAADLAQANKSRTDKKISTPEMIVDLPLSLEDTPLGGQIRSFLKNVGVEVTSYASPMPNLIKWRRKVTAIYKEGLGYWEPVAEHIREEKHVLCVMSAKEFIDLVNIDANEVDGQDLDAHVLKLKSQFEDHKPIYLIEGLTSWMRKNKNVRNRAYQAEVMNHDAGTSNDDDATENGRRQQHSTRRRKPAAEYIDEDRIEDALLRLQIVHQCLVHHTTTAVQTAEWVSFFTQHISTIPYRTERMNLQTAFCMDVGQVKSGIDKNDTYVKMLQEIVRVTGPVAYSIAAEYPNVHSLVKGFERSGPTALQDLKKTANKSGAFTNTNIGPALSKRIYKIFTGLDPSSHDV